MKRRRENKVQECFVEEEIAAKAAGLGGGERERERRRRGNSMEKMYAKEMRWWLEVEKRMCGNAMVVEIARTYVIWSGLRQRQTRPSKGRKKVAKQRWSIYDFHPKSFFFFIIILNLIQGFNNISFGL
jgi:hypothetical protein